MSLLDEQMEKCTMIDKTTVADGYGGVETKWVDGALFDCAVVLNTSIEARVAGSEGASNMYTATTKKSINLQFHDVFRRESDKKIFRVTSDGDDNKTPESAGLNMRNVSCVEWKLPS